MYVRDIVSYRIVDIKSCAYINETPSLLEEYVSFAKNSLIAILYI